MMQPMICAPKMRSPSPTLSQDHVPGERPTGSTPVSNRSRYRDEFTELRCLGRGGCGVVFEARNKIDERLCAIKKIKLSRKKCKRERVLREVKALAKMKHENIVGYHHSWMEREEPPSALERDDEDTSSCEDVDEMSSQQTSEDTSQYRPPAPSPDDRLLLNLRRSVSCSDSDGIISDMDVQSEHTDCDSDIVFEEPAADEHETEQELDEFYKSTNNNKTGDRIVRHRSPDSARWEERQTPAPKIYLYVQMELCRSDSLDHWLQNNRTRQSRDTVKDIFSQIVSAVVYVHQQGVIHRDLKPSNILFASDGRVKVGDFGLATTCDNSHDPHNQQATCVHTHGVGTETYMSPEQLMGQPYGPKVDIYSLGLILFELLYPFQTGAERAACFAAARRGRFPQDFVHSHPEEVNVVKRMLSEDPSRRPTAARLRALAPLYEAANESLSIKLLVKWTRMKMKKKYGHKKTSLSTKHIDSIFGFKPVKPSDRPNRATSLRHRIAAKHEVTDKKPVEGDAKRVVAKKIVIDDVLKILKNNSIEDKQCTVMTSYSNELLQYLIDRVNNKQTSVRVDDKYLIDLKRFALTLHFYSPQTYNNVRRRFDLCLPSRRTISRWHQRRTSAPGITLQSLEKIKLLAGREDCFICISIYESRIREQTEWVSGRWHGFVNVGNDHHGDFVELANEALVVTAMSFTCFWEIPVAHFFGRNFTGTQKAILLKLCIDALTFENVRVGCVIVDGTTANVDMATALGANLLMPPYVPCFTYKGAKYYLILKPAFLSKLAKNLFVTERLLFHENHIIKYKYVENFLMNKCNISECCIMDKELWSDTTANGIELISRKSPSQYDCIPTVTFIRNFSKLLYFCKSGTNPYRRCDEETRLECYMLCNYIRQIKLSNGDLVVDSPRKLAFSGLLYNVLALEHLYSDYLLSGKLRYIPLDSFQISYISSFDLSRLSGNISARQVSCLYDQFLYGCGVYKSEEVDTNDVHFPPMRSNVVTTSLNMAPDGTAEYVVMRLRS